LLDHRSGVLAVAVFEQLNPLTCFQFFVELGLLFGGQCNFDSAAVLFSHFHFLRFCVVGPKPRGLLFANGGEAAFSFLAAPFCYIFSLSNGGKLTSVNSRMGGAVVIFPAANPRVIAWLIFLGVFKNRNHDSVSDLAAITSTFVPHFLFLRLSALLSEAEAPWVETLLLDVAGDFLAINLDSDSAYATIACGRLQASFQFVLGRFSNRFRVVVSHQFSHFLFLHLSAALLPLR
jgi:hypothetical protein